MQVIKNKQMEIIGLKNTITEIIIKGNKLEDGLKRRVERTVDRSTEFTQYEQQSIDKIFFK